jgi:hypothetical protein
LYVFFFAFCGCFVLDPCSVDIMRRFGTVSTNDHSSRDIRDPATPPMPIVVRVGKP